MPETVKKQELTWQVIGGSEGAVLKEHGGQRCIHVSQFQQKGRELRHLEGKVSPPKALWKELLKSAPSRN